MVLHIHVFVEEGGELQFGFYIKHKVIYLFTASL